MSIILPNSSQGAGIPAQWDDTITSVAVALITGNEPAVLVEDLIFEANQTIEERTPVGFNANGRLVAAQSTVEASGTLTFGGTGTANDTIIIGSVTYTLKAAPDAVANEIKIGASAAETALNLVAAINGDDNGAGTKFGSATVAHPDVRAEIASPGVVTIIARVGGTAANSIGTTESGSNTSFGAATLTGGTAVPTNRAIGITVTKVVTGAGGEYKGAPVYRGGCFNPLALNWHASYSTEEEKIRAFQGAPTPTNIIMRRPKTATVALP